MEIGAKVDVAALLQEVERQVQAKKDQGLYDPAEIRRVEEAAVSFAQAVQDMGAAQLETLRDGLNSLWNPLEWGVSTHRTGLKGRLVLGLKKLIYKLSRFPMSVWLARQVRFNDELMKLLNIMVPQHLAFQRWIPQTDPRLDALEDLGRGHGERLRALNQRLQDLDARQGERLARLEKDAGQRRAETERLLARLQTIVEKQAAAGLVGAGAAAAVAETRTASRGQAYLDFEDLHRGSREEIKARQAIYLPYFRDAATAETPVLDLGCGRGEFIEACREAGIPARGVDINPAMVELCRGLGLEVAEGDGIEHLRGLKDASLGGILMAQVIEHLTTDQLTELVGLCAAKLRPGGALIAETINPQCLFTFAGAFYLDLTHHKPIHPEAARFLWGWAGLTDVEILYLSPLPPQVRLELAEGGDSGLAGAFNRNVQRLNDLLYSHLDYAVVGRK
ncbi:MAG: class I SAM-dependent methyltransferase [Thermodesulfobacteriota bacterium]